MNNIMNTITVNQVIKLISDSGSYKDDLSSANAIIIPIKSINIYSNNNTLVNISNNNTLVNISNNDTLVNISLYCIRSLIFENNIIKLQFYNIDGIDIIDMIYNKYVYIYIIIIPILCIYGNICDIIELSNYFNNNKIDDIFNILKKISQKYPKNSKNSKDIVDWLETVSHLIWCIRRIIDSKSLNQRRKLLDKYRPQGVAIWSEISNLIYTNIDDIENCKTFFNSIYEGELLSHEINGPIWKKSPTYKTPLKQL
eukprot:GHVL01016190.1.p1 GENE.GHVL01016190.1~~GHVL01016190.1.p1  ORF type:complete len:255 (-),score=88.21 GHVL01016190.1:36-800(-)